MINQIRIHLIAEREEDLHTAAAAVGIFRSHPGPISVELDPEPLTLTVHQNTRAPWSHLFERLDQRRKERGIPDEGLAHLLTHTPNELNWFVGTNERQPRTSFSHLADIHWYTSAPQSAIAAQFLLTAVFNALLLGPDSKIRDIKHETARGCFFDFCANKVEIALKLRTADICEDCLSRLVASGASEQLVRQSVALLEHIRSCAISTSRYLPKADTAARWPFPVALTRHKAVHARHPAVRLRALLDHFDCLVRYLYIGREVCAGRPPALVERPSLGWWVEQLGRDRGREDPYKEILRIANQERVVKIRNERLAHGWLPLRTPNFASEIETITNALEKIEAQASSFLERYELVCPRSVEIIEGQARVTGDALAGSHLLHPAFSETLSANLAAHNLLDTQKVHLYEPSERRFYSLWPYLIEATCPECTNQRLLITDGVGTYIDVVDGHRAAIADAT